MRETVDAGQKSSISKQTYSTKHTKKRKRLTCAMTVVQARTTPPVRMNILPYTSSAKSRSLADFRLRISWLAMALLAMRERCLASLERRIVSRLLGTKNIR